MTSGSLLTRRRLLRSGLGLAAAGVAGTSLAACGGSSSGSPAGWTEVTFSSVGDPTTQKMFKDMIAAAQKESLDEHKIKLVDVAHEQDAFYADPVYRRAAARRLKLIKSG